MNKIKSFVVLCKRYFSINKLILLIFAFVMIFLDENSLIKRFEYYQKINQLRKEIAHYENVIEQSKIRLNELRSNENNLEKYAREQFLMKNKDEDIFLINDK